MWTIKAKTGVHIIMERYYSDFDRIYYELKWVILMQEMAWYPFFADVIWTWRRKNVRSETEYKYL